MSTRCSLFATSFVLTGGNKSGRRSKQVCVNKQGRTNVNCINRRSLLPLYTHLRQFQWLMSALFNLHSLALNMKLIVKSQRPIPGASSSMEKRSISALPPRKIELHPFLWGVVHFFAELPILTPRWRLNFRFMACWLTKSGKNRLDGSLVAISTLSAHGLDDQCLEQ